MQVEVVGMAWYKPGDYQRLRALFEDGEGLHATYEAWLAAAELGRSRIEAKGMRVVCVDIDLDEFPKWCEARGLRLNGPARSEFVSLMARRSVADE